MKYLHKPTVVEAEQFLVDKKPWPKEVSYRIGGSLIGSIVPYVIDLGLNRVYVRGDEKFWVVTFLNGRKKLFSPEEFESNFKPVEQP